MKNPGKLVRQYMVEDGRKFRLKDFDPKSTAGVDSQEDAETLLQQGVDLLSDMQEKLYAQDSWALLLIFQAMDAAGKDGAIRHVMSGINPQGCQVYSFRAPSAEELDHDFMWRTSKRLPERGRIGIFNRSYYEETLVVRVHPDLLARQRLPSSLKGKHIWKDRFDDINAFEKYISRNGIIVRKFFLNLSNEKQRSRFLKRLEDKDRNWKFSSADVKERGHWDDYMKYYEDMIQHTATPHAPWIVVPADNKWYTRLVVAAAIVDTLQSLKLHFPRVGEAQQKELEEARVSLEETAKS